MDDVWAHVRCPCRSLLPCRGNTRLRQQRADRGSTKGCLCASASRCWCWLKESVFRRNLASVVEQRYCLPPDAHDHMGDLDASTGGAASIMLCSNLKIALLLPGCQSPCMMKKNCAID